jgi:hypothetical protein
VQIEPELERPMRNALGAAVKKDEALFNEASQALARGTGLATTVEILALIGNQVLHDMYGGALPEDDQAHGLAAAIARQESWSTLTEPEIYGYLNMIKGGGNPGVAPVVGLMLSFVVTASLLSGGRPEGQQWWDYLDVIEARIENQVP